MPVRTTCYIVLFLASPISLCQPISGQTPAVGGPLPPEVQAAALESLNTPDAVRFAGGARIPPNTSIEGDVAVLGGSLELGGKITGSLLVVNGDLRLLPGSRVQGEVVVVGGVVLGEAEAQLETNLTVYSAPLRYRIEGGRVEPIAGEGGGPGFLTSDLGFGQARLSIRAGPAYNRVEGLPVRFGGIVRTAGRNPLSLEAHGIWRSVSGLNLEEDRLGHLFRLTQAVGGRGTATIGATAHDEIAAIEDRGLSGLEVSLSTFLLHEDIRDYFRRRGWSAFATFRPGRPPLDLVLTFREEEHQTAPIRSPWTVRNPDDPWRPLPLIAEGKIRSVEAQLRWDSRDDPSFPADGWLLDLSLQKQIGGPLSLPPSGFSEADPEVDSFDNPSKLTRFTKGMIDIRRYARVGPTSRLSLRALATGNLRRAPLPPQVQMAFGGEGSLPGHPRFSLDCGARIATRRARTGEGDGSRIIEPVYPAYGCDRAVLFQAEFQGALPFSRNPLPDDWEDSELAALFNIQPVWAVFLNAGQGWEFGPLGNDVGRSDSPTRADVGVGLFLGPIGMYWSYPLNRKDRGLNFFVRLQQRF